jgi:hypothetical protein
MQLDKSWGVMQACVDDGEFTDTLRNLVLNARDWNSFIFTFDDDEEEAEQTARAFRAKRDSSRLVSFISIHLLIVSQL